MSLILRRVEKPRWYKNSAQLLTPNLSWLRVGEVQAEALRDLQPSSNTLSVYLIADPSTQIDRVAAALATMRHSFVNFDYVLVDMEVFRQIGVQIDQTQGATPDAVVNTWHLDLVELTVTKVATLASVISEYGQFHRILKKKVEQMAIEATKSQQLQVDVMPAEMQLKIRTILTKPIE